MLGYRGKTIYKIEKEKKITKKQLKIFLNRFDSIEKHYRSDKKPIDNTTNNFIDRAYSLRLKLYKQIKSEQLIENVPEETQGIYIFKNSNWYIYERFKYSIGRKVLAFDNKIVAGRIAIKIKIAKANSNLFIGEAYCDKHNDLLIINAMLSNSTEPNYYLIRIDRKSSAIDLCLGHVSFQSDIYHNIVTKTVVLEKIDGDIEPIEREFSLIEAKDQNILNIDIFKYLYKRNLNRLSSPHSTIITSKLLLNRWHEINDTLKRRKLNKYVHGIYKIYYKRNLFKPELRKDVICIHENINADTVGLYLHDVEHDEVKKWQGSVSFSRATNGIFISLQGPVVENWDETNESPLFLILNIPPNKRYNVLTGIISGMTDDNKSSVGLLVVAIRFEKGTLNISNNHLADEKLLLDILNEQEDEQTLDKISALFQAYVGRSHIVPPSSPVYSFESWQNALEDGSISKIGFESLFGKE